MDIDLKDPTYQKHLREEAEVWDKTARDELKKHAPDYNYYKETLPYKIYRHPYVEKMLEHIKPGHKVLELGCYNGWFTLELARRGAIVDAHDIAKTAIEIAQEYYKKAKAKEKFKGQIIYHVTDLNDPHFPKNTYDVVVFRNILHHIGNVDTLVSEAKTALKREGIVLADDALPCGKKEALVIGGFLMLLPTGIPYGQKLQRVFKKGKILQRTQGLVDSKDGSPFEGITGAESVDVLKKYFKVSYYTTFAAFIGVLTAQVNLPNKLKIPFLNVFNILDRSLTKINLLQGSVYYLKGTQK